jgi:hypothetical protein
MPGESGKDRAPARKPLRLTKRAARVAAWFGGTLSFVSLAVSIGLSPEPPAAATEPEQAEAPAQRAYVVLRRVVRRVVVTRVVPVAEDPQIRYVTVLAPVRTSSTTSSSAATRSVAPQPSAPEPTTETKGS